jgi:hypothetical protein
MPQVHHCNSGLSMIIVFGCPVLSGMLGKCRLQLESCTVEGSTTLKCPHPRTNSTITVEAAASQRHFRICATQGTTSPGSRSMCLARQVEILVDITSTILSTTSNHPTVCLCKHIVHTFTYVGGNKPITWQEWIFSHSVMMYYPKG